MKFKTKIQAKWRWLRLFWYNWRVLFGWAWGFAKDFARHEVKIHDSDDLLDAIDRLEAKVVAEHAAQAMGDLFRRTEPGPFQRRLVKGPF